MGTEPLPKPFESYPLGADFESDEKKWRTEKPVEVNGHQIQLYAFKKDDRTTVIFGLPSGITVRHDTFEDPQTLIFKQETVTLDAHGGWPSYRYTHNPSRWTLSRQDSADSLPVAITPKDFISALNNDVSAYDQTYIAAMTEELLKLDAPAKSSAKPLGGLSRSGRPTGSRINVVMDTNAAAIFEQIPGQSSKMVEAYLNGERYALPQTPSDVTKGTKPSWAGNDDLTADIRATLRNNLPKNAVDTLKYIMANDKTITLMVTEVKGDPVCQAITKNSVENMCTKGKGH